MKYHKTSLVNPTQAMPFKLVPYLYTLLILELIGMGNSTDCHFPAVYNFGDSNSATSATAPSPNAKPTGRNCDGRLIIDFMCEQLGLPYLIRYQNMSKGDFNHGANFAVGGASIRPGGFSEFNLGVQTSLFRQMKAQSSNQQDNFSKSLFTFDIGQNDLAYGFLHTTEDKVRASIPNILDQLSSAILLLYKEGARIFWIHNTGPVGCLPYTVIYHHSNLDRSGCDKSQNGVAQEFNKQLKNKIALLRTQLPDSMFTYVDVFSAKYALISNAKNQGFVDPMDFCCGSYYGAHVDCGQTVTVNGTVYGAPCRNPSEHISWDGIHYSQAANQWVAKHILFGSFSDPPLSITQACHL